MVSEKALLGLIVIAGAFAVFGIGYIYMFSGYLGNDLQLSPGGKDNGIQFSPGGSCQEICENGVFMGCETSLSDPVCGLSCRGAISEGPRRGEMPIIGSTRCEYTECVCN
ncbi:MAG: hypothetical protein ABH864_06655 [archaeon]